MSGLIDRLSAHAMGVGGSVVRAVAAVRSRAPLASAAVPDPHGDRFDPDVRHPATTDAVARDPRAVGPRGGSTTQAQEIHARTTRGSTASSIATVQGLHDRSRTIARPHGDAPPEARRGAVEFARGIMPRAMPAVMHPFATPVDAKPARAPRVVAEGAMPHPIPTAGRDAESESTDVHIHIGRIDVTGIEVAPERKRPAAKQAHGFRSLEDYLAKRHSE